MHSTLVVYEGRHIEAVATRIATTLEQRDHRTTAFGIETLPKRCVPGVFDAVLVGSSAHETVHPDIQTFLREHRTTLATRPTAFFQVSRSPLVDDPQRRAATADAIDSYLETLDWHPDRIGLLGGALCYSKYGFLPRLALKHVSHTATGETVEETVGELPTKVAVDRYAEDVGIFFEGRLGGGRAQSGECTNCLP